MASLCFFVPLFASFRFVVGRRPQGSNGKHGLARSHCFLRLAGCILALADRKAERLGRRWPAPAVTVAVLTAAVLTGTVLTATAAQAHKPVQIGGTASGHSPETAQAIRNPGVSQVLYLELRSPGQVDYFRFSGAAGDSIPIQLGVPKMPDLSDFRPLAILIGPGLPSAALPREVEVPAGQGLVFIRFEPGNKTFFEPFTRTTSWVTPEYRRPLPTSGDYYVAVFDPERRTGKYFLAIGQREDFSAADLAKLPEMIGRVREFYGLR